MAEGERILGWFLAGLAGKKKKKIEKCTRKKLLSSKRACTGCLARIKSSTIGFKQLAALGKLLAGHFVQVYHHYKSTNVASYRHRGRRVNGPFMEILPYT